MFNYIIIKQEKFIDTMKSIALTHSSYKIYRSTSSRCCTCICVFLEHIFENISCYI